MSLDLEIQGLLRSHEVRQIDFSMRGMRVTGHGYWQLSNCFSDRPISHRIRVSVRPQLVGGRWGAEYDPVANKIHLRSPDILNTVSGRALVLHECTHAQFDLRGRQTSIRSEEGAAYVAEAIYMIICRSHPDEIAQQVTTDIFNVAEDLYFRARETRRTPEMAAVQINTVRRAIVGLGYTTGHYVSDGINGRIYRGP